MRVLNIARWFAGAALARVALPALALPALGGWVMPVAFAAILATAVGATWMRGEIEAARRVAEAVLAARTAHQADIARIESETRRLADERVLAADSAEVEPVPADVAALCLRDPDCRDAKEPAP